MKNQQTPPGSCAVVARQVEWLCAALLLAEVALIAVFAFERIGTGPNIALSVEVIAVTWLLWIATQLRNYQLVRRYGPQAQRYPLAPQLINRPETTIRLAFHLIIN